MHHVAIMRKSWGLTEKILSGEKKIESRWYKTKRTPWGKIGKGDAVYFKNSGEPARIKAEISKVLQIENLMPKKVKAILLKYGQADGIGKENIPFFFKLFKNKKYCLLIFLKNPRKTKPFDIDKRGFGAMAGWISVPNVNTIRKYGRNRGEIPGHRPGKNTGEAQRHRRREER
jgi:ASC-1-like (ASCH) protein